MISNLLSSPSHVSIRPSPDSVFCQLDGEFVVLNYRVGTYFGLRGTGAEIWHILQHGVTFEALCSQLTSRFQVDADTCRRDAAAFVAELSEHGLIELLADAPA